MAITTTAMLTPPVGVESLKRVSWGSVVAGVLVAMMVSLLLAFLGMGIGLATVNPMEESSPMRGLGIGAAIWWVLSTLVSLFVGGCVAAHLSGAPSRADGMLHGILTWSLGTLLTFLLLGTAIGGLIGGAAGLVRQGLGMAGQGAASAMSSITQGGASSQGGMPAEMMRDAQQLLPRMAQDPQGLKNVTQAVQPLLKNGGKNVSPDERQRAVQAVAQYTDTPQQAEQIVDKWIQSAQQAGAAAQQVAPEVEQQARETGQRAAEGLSRAALWAFGGLLLSGLAAALGGRVGTPKYLVTETTTAAT